jgi:hypothetical protein
MHHTLLPESERKLIHGEYHVRVFIVSCFVLFVIGVIGVTSLFPAFTFAYLSEKSGNLLVVSSDAEGKMANSMKAELKDDATLLSFIKSNISKPSYLGMISDIVSIRGTSMIYSMSFDTVSTSSAVIVMQGLSPTRNDLLAFKSRLESMKKGNIVELPISQLTKSTDLNFSLKLTESLL